MKYKSSNKFSAQSVIKWCHQFGVKHVIISPGSRNAPLIISFDSHPFFKRYTIPDERSAAFYALGMARQLDQPVALVCTSGTAVLNYAPAIAEAYYQEVPLIVITADRPQEWIDHEDGQTIRQVDIYRNFIRYSCSLPLSEEKNQFPLIEELLTKAFSTALGIPNGPVHINVPFSEPLYDWAEVEFTEEQQVILPENNSLKKDEQDEILAEWNQSDRILVVSGVLHPSDELNRLIYEFSQKLKIPVLAASPANLSGETIFTIPDLVISSLHETEREKFRPDLLITIGGPVVSKTTKTFFRSYKPIYHWDIDLNPQRIDTYQSLTRKLEITEKEVLSFLIEQTKPKESTYLTQWNQKYQEIKSLSEEYFKTIPWSDLQVYRDLLKTINQPVHLHLANSTPVRYIELFEKHKNINYYVNRGTSGIDGSTSTAAGAALASDELTLLITGDLSFFYDSNAFWNSYVPDNLRVIVINNGGGNIFRIIKGPSSTAQLPYFEAQQKASAQKLCDAFHIKYLSASNTNELKDALSHLLFDQQKCAVLEVFTNGEESAFIFKDLYKYLKTESANNN